MEKFEDLVNMHFIASSGTAGPNDARDIIKTLVKSMESYKMLKILINYEYFYS